VALECLIVLIINIIIVYNNWCEKFIGILKMARGGWRLGAGRPPGAINKIGVDVRAAAREHTVDAVETLAAIMNDEGAPSAARVSAASAILDRGWGKPTQQLEHGVSDPLAELLDAVDGRSRGLPSRNDFESETTKH
jgi:hypothetical protein